jgi:hypothetical protein
LDGTWVGESSDEGRVGHIECVFHVTGNTFTGTIRSLDDDSDKPWTMKEGKINGNRIFYKTGNDEGGHPDAVHVTGVLNGDTLEMTIENTDGGERISATMHRKK